MSERARATIEQTGDPRVCNRACAGLCRADGIAAAHRAHRPWLLRRCRALLGDPGAAEEPSTFRFLYSDEAPLREKIETIATEVYGAGGVEYDLIASRQLESFEKQGFGNLPICMAKTHLSISSDPSLKGAPKGWTLPVRQARISAGAGFVYPICGDVRTMPGLSAAPAAHNIDIDEDGQVVGLF